jgi:hypothetical protein
LFWIRAVNVIFCSGLYRNLSSQLLSFAYSRCTSFVDSHWFQCGSESIILGQSGSGSSSGSGVLGTIFYIYSFTAKKTLFKTLHWYFLIPIGLHEGRQAAKKRSAQAWANLDQAPKDLDNTIFRDLSPTPIP